MRRFTLALVVAAALGACSKDNHMINEDLAEEDAAVAATATNSTATVWQAGYSWTRTDSAGFMLYHHDEPLGALDAAVLNGGSILVFAKNIPADSMRIPKAKKLPFYLYPSPGRPAYHHAWYYEASNGSLRIKFRSNKHQYSQEAVPVPDGAVQFRYFMFTGDDLERLGHTPVSIARLTYGEVLQLTGAAE